MNDLDLTFLELRLTILEDLLTGNKQFKESYLDAYNKFRDQAVYTKPSEWEKLVEFIDAQLERLEEEE